MGGIINQKQKTILQNLVVIVGYSTENGREGILMIFLFDINELLLLPSAHGTVAAIGSLKIVYCIRTLSQECCGPLRSCEVTGAGQRGDVLTK